jgi:outer membrane protein TolC
MKPTRRRLCVVCRLQRIAFFPLLLLAIPALVWAREPQHAPVPELPGKGEGGLTAEEVASRAEFTSPDLESKEREVDAAAAQVDAVLVGFFPRLQGDVSYTRLSYLAPSQLPLGVQAPVAIESLRNNTQLTVGLSYPVTDVLLRVSREHAAASKSAQAARLNAGATRLKIRTDAKLTFYGWVRARLQREVAERAMVQAEQHLDDVRLAFQADRVAKADVLRVESQLADAELQRARARNLVAYTESQLRVVLHGSPGEVLEVGEDVHTALPAMPAFPPLTALAEEAADNRLEVQSLLASASALRSQAAAARAPVVPSLTLVVSASDSNPSSRVFPQTDRFTTGWQAGVKASWSPNDVVTALASGRSYEAKAHSADAQLKSLKDSLAVEVAQAIQDVENADAAIGSTARGLAAAEQGYRVRRLLFQAGRATSVELTDAETELTRARQAADDARVDQRVSRARLHHALGRDVVSSQLP